MQFRALLLSCKGSDYLYDTVSSWSLATVSFDYNTGLIELIRVVNYFTGNLDQPIKLEI